MKYLRKFATEAEIADVVLPNVVLVEDGKKVLYNYLLGVFIQHIDGSLYSLEDWTKNGFANDKANGVAVCDTIAKFVIAKTQSASMLEWASVTDTAIEGLPLLDYTQAAADYEGKTNTEIIALTDTSGAAYFCANFTFPNGAKGYLPAAGELGIACAYKTEINNALNLIGGEEFVSGEKFWTSTQRDNTYAFSITWAQKSVSGSSKAADRNARPFTSLII